MGHIKDQIKAALVLVDDNDVVLEHVLHLLQHNLGSEEPYAADDEVVTFDVETGQPLTLREHIEQMEQDIEEADRDGTWITIEQAREIARKW